MTTKQVRSIEELRNAYNAGEFNTKLPFISPMAKFKKGHIFDENQSVKWNNEQVDLKNAEIDKQIKVYKADNSRLSCKLDEEIIRALQDEYELNEDQARKIKAYVYNEFHSSMHDYFYYLDEIAQLAKDIIKMGE